MLADQRCNLLAGGETKYGLNPVAAADDDYLHVIILLTLTVWEHNNIKRIFTAGSQEYLRSQYRLMCLI